MIAEQMDYDAWQASAANRMQASQNLPLAWKRLPGFDRPYFAHTPHDYALADDDRGRPNPAVGSALDGSDAGCQRREISMLPAAPPQRLQGSAPDDNFGPASPDDS